MPVTFQKVLDLALELPGMEESTSHGRPSLKVKGKFLASLKEDGETLVLRVPLSDKDFLLAADPEVFFTTPHYDGYGAVLIRLRKVKVPELRELLERSWRTVAPKKLVAARPPQRS